MIKNKTLLSLISNIVLSSILIFFLIFIWSISTLNNRKISLIISITITTVITSIIIYVTHLNYKKSKLQKINLNKLEYIKNQLLYGSNNDIVNYYKLIFPSYKQSFNMFYNSHQVISLMYSKELVELNDIIPIYKNCNNKHLTILCISYNKLIDTIISKHNLNIEILDLKSTIEKYLQNNTPNFNIITNSTSFNFKNIIKNIFNKSRIKGYIFTSIFLLLYSMFVPFKMLYVLLALFLIVLALISILINIKKHLS